jgi:surfeit locus 1 family protein
MSAKSAASEKLSVALRINWTLVSLGVVLLAILLRLGFWQLERAEEKRQLHNHIEHQQSLPPIALSSLEPAFTKTAVPAQSLSDTLEYRQVTLTGQFDAERYWLLDNQVHHGKVGYHVIGLFIAAQGWNILVNRGWVQAPARRELLPAVSFPSESLTLTGRLVVPSVNPLMAQEPRPTSSDTPMRWPSRIQSLSIEDVEQALVQPLYPALLQLTADDGAALVMEWRDINVSAAKHQGYAVQWFAMAVALVIALIFANTNLTLWFSEKETHTSQS